jgi:uncharacterized repeat protein (TIGR03803 family)
MYAIFVLCATTAIALPAQTFTSLFSFDSTDGAAPLAGLVQATSGDFYGTTDAGGANGLGTVFKVTPTGALKMLYSLCAQSGCTDGATPQAGLVQATNGDFYGTTLEGGAYGGGTVFKITPGGTLTTLYSFCSQGGSNCPDGANPTGLVQATTGDLYGTTSAGGTSSGGTVFKITPSGTLTTLYFLCAKGDCIDGEFPGAGLVQGTDGNFYGTTYGGGAIGGYGTVFKITPRGKLTTLYRFCSQTNCTDGEHPMAGLIQATNGYFYGTTWEGGANNFGTVFQITPSGMLTTLYSFCSQTNCTDGGHLNAGLVQATDGNLYGTAYEFGVYVHGTAFEIAPAPPYALTTLYSFCAQTNCADGDGPNGLFQATNGEIYGTTGGGGANGVGTVFGLSVGLGPFVETQTTSGKVGAAVKILGNNLTGATSVTFHGIAAVSFKVVSASEITTTVPNLATTGTVQVVTASGATLSSNVPFRVLP